MKRIKILILIVACSMFSCNDYLEVKPKGILIPETVADFEGLLNSETLARSYPNALYYASDDIYADLSPSTESPEANAYFWRQHLDINNDDSPEIWGSAYHRVYTANVIINGVMQASDGSEQKKQQVLGEALTFRADAFFTLLTAFAKAYDPATATSDPGLPLVSSVDVTTEVPPRASLQASLDHIITDLETAITYLPERNINRSRMTKYVAFGLLSRVYLYMYDYKNAEKFAALALEAPHEILDFNLYTYPPLEEDPETLWMRVTEDESLVFYLFYSQDLVDQYEADDLRFLTFAMDFYGNGQYLYFASGWANTGITFPEMLLTRAEALAHMDQVEAAMDMINKLREKRIASYAYLPLEAATQDEALDIILAERRRELAFKGTRWFDMKRLSKQGRIGTVKRFSLDHKQLAELAPNSPNYTYEIPSRVLLFNPDMVKNHNN